MTQNGRLPMRAQSLLLPMTLLAAGLLACSDSTGGGGNTRPPSQLTFIRLAPTAPVLCADSVGFWAVKGVGVEAALEFPEAGSTCAGETEDFLRLKLDAASLATLPNGTPIATGDSVFISIVWVGNDTIMFHLAPTGLTFDPAHPAKLKIEYGEAGDDLDEDGDTDAADAQVESEMSIWRQPTLSDDFVKLGTVKSEDTNEIEADLNGFSRYAIAY